MTFQQCKDQPIIIDLKQLIYIKGGNSNSDSNDIFVVEDIDVI